MDECGCKITTKLQQNNNVGLNNTSHLMRLPKNLGHSRYLASNHILHQPDTHLLVAWLQDPSPTGRREGCTRCIGQSVRELQSILQDHQPDIQSCKATQSALAQRSNVPIVGQMCAYVHYFIKFHWQKVRCLMVVVHPTSFESSSGYNTR